MRRSCRVCGRGSDGPYCTEHKPAEDRRRTAWADEHGLRSSHWQRVRTTVLERDGRRCRLNLDGCTGAATTVHLDPSRGSDHHTAHPDDCVAACNHCNVAERNTRVAGVRTAAAAEEQGLVFG